jgi:CBS-domain-containing membrane protein
MFSLIKSRIDPLSLKEKLINALAATFAIFVLGCALKVLPHANFVLPLLASMGASAFLLFIVPHSPMAQPWPVFGGHLISAIVAVTISHLTDNSIVASACIVGGSILAMQLLNCLHPPGAATALAAMAGTQLHNMDVQFIVYVVLGNAIIMVLMAYIINKLLLKRRYPMLHSHHPHHEQFQHSHSQDMLNVNIEDIRWALEQMDGIIDASEEDLIDIYELALEHAITAHRPTQQNN